jgi:hypothetical protein
MRTIIRRVPLLLVTAVVAAGCATTKISNREVATAGEQLVKPGMVYVYDFGATAADVPAESALAEHAAGAPAQTLDQIATGRQLGSEIAKRLVDELRGRDISADRASTSTVPAADDVVIKGYLYSVEEGSGTKRVVIGFGSGSAELKTAVEAYQMNAEGALRKLGSGTIDSGGGKTPGMVLPAAVAVATANPIGLIVVGGAKAYGELSGKSQIEGKAKQTADAIAEQIEKRYKEEGWLD